MSQIRPDPTQIGDISIPPFVMLPDPSKLFTRREARLRELATHSDIAPYLNFVADIVSVQRDALIGLPAVDLPEPALLWRAREHAMPPIDRAALTHGAALDATLDAFFSKARDIAMPLQAREALSRVLGVNAERRFSLAQNVLTDAIPQDALAEHVFVAAALQIHFARIASRLDAATLIPVGDGVCPACGGAPCVSMVVGWHGAQGARFCVCSLCSTLWHFVRIRCTVCGTTKGLSYRQIDGAAGSVKGECCSECGSYLKILYQTIDPAVEPVADDIASSSLDLLLRQDGERRAGVNPFLIGY
jgi:FdhE protein